MSSGITLSSGQAIKDSAGKAILSLAQSTNPQTGGLYLYTSGTSNLYHNDSPILTTNNFLTNCEATLDDLYVNIDGDTMTGPLTINTSGDAYINVKNSSHGWQVRATSVTRGIFDNKASQFIIYQTASDTKNILNIAQVPLAIASDLTASGTAAFNGATTFASTVALNNKTTVASNTYLYFGGTTYYVSGGGVANLKNIAANGTLTVTGATTLQDTLAVTGISSFTGAVTASSTVAAVGSISSEDTISAPYIAASAKLTSKGTAIIESDHTTQALTVTGGATFGETIVAKKAEIGTSGATIGGTTTAQHINPSTHNTYDLGTNAVRWKNIYAQGTIYATAFSGNATSASKLSTSRAVTLSGDISGTGSSDGSSDWSITTTIGTSKVTNAMLAGSIANSKLTNSSIDIAGTSVALGGSISATTLRTNLGLTNAMHYIGVATTPITNQSNTDPKISGYTWPDDRLGGDVVIYGTKEYVWNSYNSRWELLGDEGSYKVLQTAVTSPSASGNASAFIDTISQDANGKITATKKNVQISISATATDDDVVVLTGTAGTNGVTYNATHAKKGPSSGAATYTSGNTVTSLTGAATSFSIPQITVDTYGHTTAGTDETITITLPKSGGWFNNGFVTVNGSGVSEIGRYLDFHSTTGSTNDFDVRIDAGTGAAKNTLYLPDVSGQFVVHTNNTAVGSGIIPTYVAASGAITASTATVGSDKKPMWLNAGTLTEFTATEGSASLPVYLNNGVITACTQGSLFSDFSSTAGASGETLSITVAGQTRTVTLDAATTTQGGVITTGTQSFAGAKTFTGGVTLANSTTGPYVYFKPTTADNVFGNIFLYTPVTSSAITSNRFYFRQYSYTSSSTTRLDYYENYMLPTVTAGRTANGSYNILTTKSAVTVAQGGTGKSSWTKFRLIYAAETNADSTSSTTLSQIAAGTSGYVLQSNGTTAAPSWLAQSSIAAGTAVQFASGTTVAVTGDATGTSETSTRGWSVPLTLADSGVASGSYGPSAGVTLTSGGTFAVPYFTVDSKGRVTAASTKTMAMPTIGNATISISAGSGLTGGGSFSTNQTSAGTITLNVGAGAGLSVADDSIGHSNSVTAKTSYGSTATSASANGGTIIVTDVKYDEQGHITGSTDRSIKLSQTTYTLSGLGGVDTVSASGTSPLTLSASKNGTTVTIAGSMTAASSDAAGYVTTGSQTIAGAKTFSGAMSITNTTASTSTTTGALKVSGGLGVAGAIYGATVHNAVWNDYAEYRKAETIEPGRVVIENVSGEMKMSTERLQAGASIISDTFGSVMGETEECKSPVAVAGRVLAYTYEDRDSYPLGAAVCTGPNGTVSLMTRDEIMMYPERIIGTVSEIPNYKTWGTGNVEVNGRIWIKVR